MMIDRQKQHRRSRLSDSRKGTGRRGTFTHAHCGVSQPGGRGFLLRIGLTRKSYGDSCELIKLSKTTWRSGDAHAHTTHNTQTCISSMRSSMVPRAT